METVRNCPRCGSASPSVGHFCPQCGLALDATSASVGRAPHPNPVAIPDGYRPCQRAFDLHFRTQSAWGGTRLLGTENVGLSLFNAGYPLQTVVLNVEGLDESGQVLFSVEEAIESLPRGREVEIEIPSYEITEPAREISVTLVSAEYKV